MLVKSLGVKGLKSFLISFIKTRCLILNVRTAPGLYSSVKSLLLNFCNIYSILKLAIVFCYYFSN